MLDDNLDEEALAWVVRLTSGASTSADHDAFRSWRDRSPDHAAALARARQLWVHLGNALPQAGSPAAANDPVRRAWRDPRLLAVAASVAIVVLASHQYFSVWQYDYTTGRGESQTVDLSDGSKVKLGPNAALTIRYSNTGRAVELARGEALFRVRHDSASPFTVLAGQTVIRDIGTVFDVAHSSETTTVVVAEGSVNVSNGRTHASLVADQATSVRDGLLEQVRNIDADEALAWSNGRLVMENQPLATVLDKLRPFYAGRIVLLNSDRRQEPLSAVIDLNRIDEWIDALSSKYEVKVTRFAGITILR